MGETSMRCSEELLDELHDLKRRGESYEDVVWRLIEERNEHEPVQEENGDTSDALDLDNVTIDVPGSGELEDRRQETIVRMAELLREQGSAEKDDFLAIVDPDHVGYKTKSSFWSNCVKGRDSLRSIPKVESPKTGLSEWKWAD